MCNMNGIYLKTLKSGNRTCTRVIWRPDQKFEPVLRPGGVLLMTVGTSRHEGTRRNWLESGHPMFWSTPGEGETHTRLREVGFEITEERTVDDPLGSEALFVFAESRS